jgi:hypothetical protein
MKPKKRKTMSKFKDLLIDIESCIANGDMFEDIITFVQTSTGCDQKTASDLVFQVEGEMCMDEESSYYEEQIVLSEGFSVEE